MSFSTLLSTRVTVTGGNRLGRKPAVTRWQAIFLPKTSHYTYHSFCRARTRILHVI